MSAPTENMVSLNLRVPVEARRRLEALAEALAARDLNATTVSDVARMAMGRGLPALEAELGIATE